MHTRSLFPESPSGPSEAETSASSDSGVGPPKFSTKDERQEFFLPVTGFVWLYPEEVSVVDHPAFQRLGNIYQLGQTYLVYRGATHRRMEHVLGALYVVQRMIEAVGHNAAKSKSRGPHAGAPLSSHEERFTRLGALLHDIGHVAAGHTLEDELHLIGKHDEDQRLDTIFNGGSWRDRHGRTLAELIDEEFGKYVPENLARDGIKASEILRMLVRKPPAERVADKYHQVQQQLANSSEIRLQVCYNMIGNTICADLLDYLHRDWYHVGKPRPFDERILQYMEIRTKPEPAETRPAKPKATDTFVISLGKRPKIRTDAVSAVLELLEWRYQLTESVLFHRTKLAAAAMLDRALYELWIGHDAREIEESVLRLGDDELLSESIRLAAAAGAKGTVAGALLRSLRQRELYTGLSTFVYDDLPADVRAAVRVKYADPSTRARMLMLLEQDFALPPGSIVMYCPSTAAMNAKIAKVRIAIGSEEDQFDEYEKRHENQLSGGHLEAQLHRFRRLWRTHFFINRAVKTGLSADVLHALRQAIEKLALGSGSEEDRVHAAHALAVQLSALPKSPWRGRGVRSEVLAAAYQDPTAAHGNYPFGAPSIRAYFEPPGEPGAGG